MPRVWRFPLIMPTHVRKGKERARMVAFHRSFAHSESPGRFNQSVVQNVEATPFQGKAGTKDIALTVIELAMIELGRTSQEVGVVDLPPVPGN